MIRNKSGVLLVGTVLSLFAGTLAVGAWKHYTQQEDTLASAEQRRTFVPTVRVATVKPTSGELTVPPRHHLGLRRGQHLRRAAATSPRSVYIVIESGGRAAATTCRPTRPSTRRPRATLARGRLRPSGPRQPEACEVPCARRRGQ